MPKHHEEWVNARSLDNARFNALYHWDTSSVSGDMARALEKIDELHVVEYGAGELMSGKSCS